MSDPVLDALQALPKLVLWLEVDLVAATRQPSRSQRPARPPMDLDVVSDLQEAWNALTTWSRDWSETFGYVGPTEATWPHLCHWMATAWPRVQAEHPAAPDFAEELLHRHSRDCDDTPPHAIGWYAVLRRHREDDPDRRWQPLPGRWTCPVDECGGVLMEDVVDRIIVCRRCDTSWVGEAEYQRLGLILGVDPFLTLEQAARLQGVRVSSVKRWIGLGLLPCHTRDGVEVVDRVDLELARARAS